MPDVLFGTVLLPPIQVHSPGAVVWEWAGRAKAKSRKRVGSELAVRCLEAGSEGNCKADDESKSEFFIFFLLNPYSGFVLSGWEGAPKGSAFRVDSD
jgi:hypothetical protein